MYVEVQINAPTIILCRPSSAEMSSVTQAEREQPQNLDLLELDKPQESYTTDGMITLNTLAITGDATWSWETLLKNQIGTAF